jgi:hypothetical protein
MYLEDGGRAAVDEAETKAKWGGGVSDGGRKRRRRASWQA